MLQSENKTIETLHTVYFRAQFRVVANKNK